MGRRVGAPLLVVLALALAGTRGLVQGRALRSAATKSSSCTPQQIHVSLTGNPTELRVTWKTIGSSCPSGITSGPASALSTTTLDLATLTMHRGSQHSYSAADMCSAPARTFHYGPTYLHTAVLTGLEPGGRYFYQIEGGKAIEFAAAVPTGPTHRFSFLIFGDMGESEHKAAKAPGASRTMVQLQREVDDGAELIMHVGDISYANGREQIWDTFMEAIEPFAQHVPYHVAVGNHEYDYEYGNGGGVDGREPTPDPSGETSGYRPEWGNYGNDSGGECGVQISRRFLMPDVAEYGYWTRGLNGSAAGSSSSSNAAGGGSSGASRRNPTLGPGAAKLLAAALAERQQMQQDPMRKLQVAVGPASSSSSTAAASQQALHVVAELAQPNPPFWYSFSHGSVHFVVVSTEHDLRPGSKQYRWLERDLQLADRCSTPWLVLSMHRPMYVVYPHKSNRIVADHLRAQLEGLLNEYQVDLVVSGHVHSYSRTCNVLNKRCVPADKGGTTHIIVGCAGHRLTDVSHAQEEWLEYAAVRFGYGRVTVNSGFSLLFEMVGDDGVAHDSVKLHNSRANMRGCSYTEGSKTEAVLASYASGPAASCAPGLQRGTQAGSAVTA